MSLGARLRIHTKLIAISASRDGDEVGVSFDRSPLLLKVRFQMETYNTFSQ